MLHDLEHPEITMARLTGYPSWMQDDDEDDFDKLCDMAYEERRDARLWDD